MHNYPNSKRCISVVHKLANDYSKPSQNIFAFFFSMEPIEYHYFNASGVGCTQIRANLLQNRNREEPKLDCTTSKRKTFSHKLSHNFQWHCIYFELFKLTRFL